MTGNEGIAKGVFYGVLSLALMVCIPLSISEALGGPSRIVSERTPKYVAPSEFAGGELFFPGVHGVSVDVEGSGSLTCYNASDVSFGSLIRIDGEGNIGHNTWARLPDGTLYEDSPTIWRCEWDGCPFDELPPSECVDGGTFSNLTVTQ